MRFFVVFIVVFLPCVFCGFYRCRRFLRNSFLNGVFIAFFSIPRKGDFWREGGVRIAQKGVSTFFDK